MEEMDKKAPVAVQLVSPRRGVHRSRRAKQGNWLASELGPLIQSLPSYRFLSSHASYVPLYCKSFSVLLCFIVQSEVGDSEVPLWRHYRGYRLWNQLDVDWNGLE
jgi:hypothetical protein